ncbi:MAG: outer membrane protein assembly factor BamB [Mariniblastus sp.]|jgi:outer membrane protein assembly factor BamB
MKRHSTRPARFARFVEFSVPRLFLVCLPLQFLLIGSPTLAQNNAVQNATKGSGTQVENIGTRKQGEDWPVFLGPRGDSTSTEKGIITEWNKGLKVLWTLPLGESYGIGTVSRGRYFQFDRIKRNAKTTCLNAETGEEIWTYEYETDYRDIYGYNGGPRCSPIVDDDRVYIYGVEGRLTCLHVVTGEKIWEVEASQKYNVEQNFFGVGSNPVIYGDLLIVMVGGTAPGQPGDTAKGAGTGIVAFDKFSGKQKYAITDQLASYASLKLARIKNRDWCFAFARGGLVGFEPASGKVDFQYPWKARILESVNASVPVVVGSEVFISETYGPGASLLDVKPGGYDITWQDDARVREKAFQAHWNTPIHRNGFLYGSSGRHEYNAVLRCIDRKTGKVQWDQPELTRSSLLYVDGHFICQCENGVLRLLKVNSERFEHVDAVFLRGEDTTPLLKEPCWAAPILSHGLLYLRGEDRVICVELIPVAK